VTSETATAISEAFLEHREAFGVPLTIGGVAIVAAVNEAPYGRELVEGGFAEDGDIAFKILLSDLETLPSISTACTYKERSFRIQKVSIQPGGMVGEYTVRPTRR